MLGIVTIPQKYLLEGLLTAEVHYKVGLLIICSQPDHAPLLSPSGLHIGLQHFRGWPTAAVGVLLVVDLPTGGITI